MISKLEDLLKKDEKAPLQRLAVAWPHDAHTLGAVREAVENELVHPLLVGDPELIAGVCKEVDLQVEKVTVVPVAEEGAAALQAVTLVREGEADLLMKGTVSTDKFMRAILNKEKGLVPPGGLLTHVSVLEPVNYHKMLVVGDVAIIPQPALKEKKVILEHLVRTARMLGIDKPKVAVITATEQVLTNMEACVDAALLAKMAERGQIKNAWVEGPIALDVALDKESARIKKIASPVAGDADCLLFPDIEAGNVFYKCYTKLLKGSVAAMVAGASVPVILSSRGDSTTTKLYSIALGVRLAQKRNKG
jgi:phosphate butyryltransferase